ncbi:uncharacterized protein K441DRAFT_710237, partial [Cenococcum geophilum 1.58]|uniref:uncharacterized protein n=1 Tax=Cenococcum geophilum 1.58 TaxID=794803 RepID=UPI00358EA029
GPENETDKSEDENDDKKTEPAREKVMLDPKSFQFAGEPLGTLFPFLESSIIKNLPIESLEFTYSEEEEENSFYPPGLRLEVDVLFKDGLQWAGDLLKNLFGDHKLPTSIHLSAHLSKERDWSKRPKINELVLKGEFRNLGLKPWDFLEFNTIGIELTATQAAGKDKEKKSWNFGFGLFGTLRITKIPHANAPLEMKYRIARDFVPGMGKDENEDDEDANKSDDEDDEDSDKSDDKVSVLEAGKKIVKKDSGKLDKKGSKKAGNAGDSKRLWNLVITSDKWEDIYGIKNVTITKAQLKTSFKEGDFKKSLKLELSADLTLGDGSFKVTGQISNDNNFLKAEIGDLKLNEIKRIYQQISGQKSPVEDSKPSSKDEDETAGNDLIFEKLSLELSSKKIEEDKTTLRALQLDGRVTFNSSASANAKLRIASDGLTIEGGIDDYKIPDTEVTIKQAGLSIFIGFKQKGNKAGDDAESDNEDASSTTSKNGEYRDFNLDDLSTYNSNQAIYDKEPKKKESKVVKCKGKVVKRENKFEILGVIEIKNITVKVGIHISRKKGKTKRDWLVFGAVEGITLSRISPELKGTFLDLQLHNVAFIASSEAREKKRKDDGKIEEEKEKKKTEDEKKEDANDEGEKTASWDVLAQVKAYNYPIVSGMQLCATISKFEEMEILSRGKNIDGFVLIVSIHRNGKIEISINMPDSFAVPLTDNAKLGDFGASISVGTGGPELKLTATLTLEFEDQEPIEVRGDISAGTIGAGVAIWFMTPESEWVNPFKLSEKLVIKELGVGTDIVWATFLKTGPSNYSLSGQLNIGDFKGKIVFGIGPTSPKQVFLLKITKINISKIVQLAEKMTDNVQIWRVDGGEDTLVFNDLKLYFSTGAIIFDKYYKHGIHVRGKVKFFDKTGDFDGRFSSDGLVIEAGLDNFKIGGLEVTSARADQGVERATMKIEMTTEKQRIFIDGMIRCYDSKLKILIDADLQKKHFRAHVYINFTDSLLIDLKAVAQVENRKNLVGILVEFEAELNVDIFGAIFDGISKGIQSLAELATKAIEEAEADLERQIKENQEEVRQMEIELKVIKARSEEEVASRRKQIEKENTERSKARKELDILEKAVENAEINYKNQKDCFHEKRAKKDAAERKLDDMVRAKTQEYYRKITKEKSNQARWDLEKKTLEERKNRSWGDELRKYETVEKHWNEGQSNSYLSEMLTTSIEKIKAKDEWKQHCWTMFQRSSWFERVYWKIKFDEANVGLELLKADVGIGTAVLDIARFVHNLPGLRAIELAIWDAGKELEKFGKALERLTTQGPGGYIDEILKDEKRDLQDQIQTLNDLDAKSKELEKVLKRARDLLNKNKGRLTTAEENAQSRITKLEQEIELKPFENAYRNKKRDHDNVAAQIQTIQETLMDTKASIKGGTEITKQVVETLKDELPRVTKILVKASTKVFVDDKPLIFEITAKWKGETGVCRVEWVPGSKPSELYREVASKLVTRGERTIT